MCQNVNTKYELGGQTGFWRAVEMNYRHIQNEWEPIVETKSLRRHSQESAVLYSTDRCLLLPNSEALDVSRGLLTNAREESVNTYKKDTYSVKPHRERSMNCA